MSKSRKAFALSTFVVGTLTAVYGTFLTFVDGFTTWEAIRTAGIAMLLICALRAVIQTFKEQKDATPDFEPRPSLRCRIGVHQWTADPSQGPDELDVTWKCYCLECHIDRFDRL